MFITPLNYFYHRQLFAQIKSMVPAQIYNRSLDLYGFPRDWKKTKISYFLRFFSYIAWSWFRSNHGHQRVFNKCLPVYPFARRTLQSAERLLGAACPPLGVHPPPVSVDPLPNLPLQTPTHAPKMLQIKIKYFGIPALQKAARGLLRKLLTFVSINLKTKK